ncbi:hypothetical protein [Vibrio europaeus]|uniref:hypothetical protein n=1 Tax=Vibrio europaeus TaxID=300876 RepID=UPI00233E814F|nr:hypothetical protein [Vibrio europaeus]MDC5840269.1 hypothetical protein [Vibrio europaeus]MDC5856009.1 hypothetical protein [Vibrio europaeus]
MVWTILLVASFGFSLYQLSFAAFSNVLDGGWLSIISAGVGVAFAPIVRIFQKWKANKNINVLRSPNDATRFYERTLNFPVTSMLAILTSIAFFSVSNHKFAIEEQHSKTFEVVKISSMMFKNGSQFNYVHVSDGSKVAYISIDESRTSSYKKGDLVKVKVKKGLWGFYIVEDLAE